MRMPSRNRWNMSQSGRFLVSHSIPCDMVSHCGRPSRRPRLVVCFGRARAKPTTVSFFAARMTTFRQARGSLRLDRADLVQSAYRLVRDSVGLFFQPANHGTPRTAERSFKSTQATALLIGPKNLFASFGRIAGRLRIITTLASTGAATLFLLAVWRDSVRVERCSATMTAYRCGCIPGVNPFSASRHDQYSTPFDQRPLPNNDTHKQRGAAQPAVATDRFARKIVPILRWFCVALAAAERQSVGPVAENVCTRLGCRRSFSPNV
jgi:hypothetical protein